MVECEMIRKGCLVAYVDKSVNRFARISAIRRSRRGVVVVLDHGCNADIKNIGINRLRRMKNLERVGLRELLYRVNAVAHSLSVAPEPTDGP